MESQITKSKLGVIKSFLGKIWGKNKKRNIIISVILLSVLGYGYYNYYGVSKATTYEYSKVSKKDIQKTVEGSGNVVSVSELDIQQLQNGGKITSVRVKPGDFVKRGQIIATLDSRQAIIQVQQAKAAYNKLINGSTDPTLAILRQNVTNAQSSYNEIKAQQDLNVLNSKRNLYNSNIIAVSQYDSKLQANSPTVSGAYTCDSEQYYSINVYQQSIAQVNPSLTGSVNISSVPQKIDNCGLYLSFDSSKDYSGGFWTISIPNKLSSNYISNLNSYDSALITRDTALLNASTSITNARLSLNQSTAQPRPEDVQASLASVESANLNYENTLIRAPFDGQIGAVSAAVGQQTNSQQGVATIITKDKIAQISLNEADIVNVKLGQDVNLTFDAIPNETFKGRVSEINTVGIATSNVVSFAVKISIPNADQRIKSGMSVTSNIVVDSKLDVLTVPSGTIKTEGSGQNTKSYVMRMLTGVTLPIHPQDTSSTSDNISYTSGSSTATRPSTTQRNGSGKNRVTITGNGTNEKVYVTTGLSNNIDTEIISGLNLGDLVVSKTSSGGSTTKTTTAFSIFGSGRPSGGRGPGG